MYSLLIVSQNGLKERLFIMLIEVCKENICECLHATWKTSEHISEELFRDHCVTSSNEKVSDFSAL